MKNEQSINEVCTGRTNFQGESKVHNRFIPLRATPSTKKIPNTRECPGAAKFAAPHDGHSCALLQIGT